MQDPCRSMHFLPGADTIMASQYMFLPPEDYKQVLLSDMDHSEARSDNFQSCFSQLPFLSEAAFP